MVFRILAGISTVLIGIWLNDYVKPEWNILSQEMWIFLLVYSFISFLLFLVAEFIANLSGSIYTYTCTMVACMAIAMISIISIVMGLIIVLL